MLPYWLSGCSSKAALPGGKCCMHVLQNNPEGSAVQLVSEKLHFPNLTGHGELETDSFP